MSYLNQIRLEILNEDIINKETIEIELELSTRIRLRALELELGIERKELVERLIALVTEPEAGDINILKRVISLSIRKGVNYRFIKSCKSLYVFLGHFLKKVREIR